MSNPARLYVGVDNTQPNVARVVLLRADDLFYTWPVLRVRCRSLPAFQAFWKGTSQRGQPVALATTVVPHDPFDILAWLREQGVPATRHDHLDLLGDFDQPFELPRHYRRAHALALRGAYTWEAPRVVEELWHEMYHLDERYKETRKAFDRLLALMPCPF